VKAKRNEIVERNYKVYKKTAPCNKSLPVVVVVYNNNEPVGKKKHNRLEKKQSLFKRSGLDWSEAVGDLSRFATGLFH